MNLTDERRRVSALEKRFVHTSTPRKIEDLTSFRVFLRDAWPIIEPGRSFVTGLHLDAIADHLEAVARGDIKRLLVNMPPRHGKSSLISVLWSAWLLLRNPATRLLCASYAMNLATRDNLKARRLIKSPWFTSRYGAYLALTSDQDAKTKFETTLLGYRMATSVGSSTTGEGGDVLILDDAHNIDEKESEVRRAAALDWFDNTWSTRLNDPQQGCMVVVGQRIHQQDVSGHILSTNDGEWVHLNLPAEFEQTRACTTMVQSVTFWQDWRSYEGELLWPARFNQSVIEKAKRRHGSMGYAALYQQAPVPSDGGIFKQQWVRYFTEVENVYLLECADGIRSVLKTHCWRFAVVDLAVSSKQSADYTVIQVYDVTPQNELLLIEQVRDRLSNPQQQQQIRLLHLRYVPDFFKVESVGYQLSLVQQLRHQQQRMDAPIDLHYQSGDLLVETDDPAALDRALASLQELAAFLVKNRNDECVLWEGYAVVRVAGDLAFFRYVLEHQKHGRVVGEITSADIENERAARSRFAIPIKEYRPVKDKVSRASSAAVLMENEKIFFRKGAPYLTSLLPEILTFPKASYDDQVDGLSMAADEIAIPRVPLSGEGEHHYGAEPSTSHVPLAPVQPSKRNAPIDPFEWVARHYGEWDE